MSSHSKKCCMAGCESVGVHQHRFPNPAKDLDRFNIWLDILGSEDLRAMDPAKVFTNRRICSCHFLPKYFSSGNPRLHKNAVPTLDMSVDSPILPDHQSSEPGPSASYGTVTDNRAHRGTTPENTIEYRSDVFRSASVTRQNIVTPKAQVLYRTALHWKKTALRSKRMSFQARLSQAERYAEANDVEKMSVMSPTAQLFLKLQLRESKKAQQSQRFTIEEKTMSLSLLKQSAKGYDLLEKMFALPSRKTLNKFLGKITLRAGINKRLFAVLRTNVMKMKPLHRNCTLMFDEISLSPRLQYNVRLDQIDGFVDDGVNRNQDFADHALVFMVRGVVRNWKQAVAFTFCEGTTKSTVLKELIKEVIVELRAIGLTVISTVCEQAATNCSAINQLIQETKEDYIRRGKSFQHKSNRFEISRVPIIALYDVPHLFKGLRNHFIKENIVCTMKGERMTGNWQHIEACYEIDQQEETGNLRLCPTLTDRHIKLDQSSYKMKVKYCTQVLSQRVAAMMNLLAKNNDICAEAKQTAQIVLFLDQLFDSLNSSSRNGTEGKPLTGALTENSTHWQFWKIACEVLRSMEFVSNVDMKKSHPPSLKHFSVTIQGIYDIFKITKQVGAQFLCLRNFNQDPLENFFGMIRSQGARNISPTCSAFTASFKILTINNYMAKNSVGGNCEEDVTEGALSTLQELLTGTRDEESIEENYENPELVNILLEDNVEISNYCAGFIVHDLKRITKKCVLCKSEVEAFRKGPQHAVISFREYSTNVDPSFSAAANFIHCKKIIIEILKQNCHKKNILKDIIQYILDNINFDFLTCSQHKFILTEIIIHKTCELIMYNYIKVINNILCGKRTIVNKNSILENKAKNRYVKYCNYKTINKKNL